MQTTGLFKGKIFTIYVGISRWDLELCFTKSDIIEMIYLNLMWISSLFHNRLAHPLGMYACISMFSQIYFKHLHSSETFPQTTVVRARNQRLAGLTGKIKYYSHCF